MSKNSIQRQREYYAKTSLKYDEMHLSESEHELALAQLTGYLNYYSFSSMLDVGAGTGRVLRHSKRIKNSLKVLGVEPVAELREVAYANDVLKEELIDGDATALNFEDNSWDIVCAFGILHHIPNPKIAIKEMCRVAKYGVFFSDLNNYGCGSLPQRLFSQTLRSLNLWKVFQWMKNGGKHEKYSEGDGIHYSYSLFDNLDEIKEKFPQTFICNTKGVSPNLFKGCSHISIFAVNNMETITDISPDSTSGERNIL